jgi:hypothetical protein
LPRTRRRTTITAAMTYPVLRSRRH